MFQVPEPARLLTGPLASDPGWGGGAFQIDSVEPGWLLILIADDGRCPGYETGWEHVSVRALEGRDPAGRARRSRIPTWREMSQVKELFWDADAVVVQYHPARRDYVNTHPHVLHLWRPLTATIPLPPLELV